MLSDCLAPGELAMNSHINQNLAEAGFLAFEEYFGNFSIAFGKKDKTSSQHPRGSLKAE